MSPFAFADYIPTAALLRLRVRHGERIRQLAVYLQRC
jgi:hypothetical protein